MAKDTKQKLMDAALDIFIRDGYDGANIKDICAEVGIVKSAFYRHFDSKETLWNEMIEQIATHYNRHFNSRKNAIQIPSSSVKPNIASAVSLNRARLDEI